LFAYGLRIRKKEKRRWMKGPKKKICRSRRCSYYQISLSCKVGHVKT